LDELASNQHALKAQIGIVGMRVDGRTLAADQLTAFVRSLKLPVLGMLRDTQNYLHLAASGLTLFDVVPAKLERDLAQWKPICQWLDKK
jgi:chromosome partitioning protein